MFKFAVFAFVLVLANEQLDACLITNCPRGGKRSGGGKLSLQEANIKPCVSCGPGRAGQCFGPSICCGPFGCLLGTQDTVRCQRDGFFNEKQPCIAGSSSCRKNTGLCAANGICCSQDSCHSDRSCVLEDKSRLQENPSPLELYSFLNADYAPEK